MADVMGVVIGRFPVAIRMLARYSRPALWRAFFAQWHCPTTFYAGYNCCGDRNASG